LELGERQEQAATQVPQKAKRTVGSMSLLNKAAIKRAALDLANAKFKERNKTRMEMGIAPLKAPPSRVSGEFIDKIETSLRVALSNLVNEHKTGATL